jgi:membrane protein YdbS with pleckstrin-like domain
VATRWKNRASKRPIEVPRWAIAIPVVLAALAGIVFVSYEPQPLILAIFIFLIGAVAYLYLYLILRLMIWRRGRGDADGS